MAKVELKWADKWSGLIADVRLGSEGARAVRGLVLTRLDNLWLRPMSFANPQESTLTHRHRQPGTDTESSLPSGNADRNNPLFKEFIIY
jgi:hypothetical protein